MNEPGNTRIWDEIKARKWRFLTVFFLIFFLTLTFLVMIGAVPEQFLSTDTAETTRTAQDTQSRGQTSVLNENVVQPTRVVIDSIGIDVEIVNPQSRDIAVLDAALKDGVVHFPGSGGLNQDTNMFLFGHSSSLPIVRNQNYKAFNGLEKLQSGDIIRVYGDGREYLYKVTRVSTDDAAAIRVPLERGEKKLTLSTCDSFGAEGDRHVVEADFVGSYPVSA